MLVRDVIEGIENKTLSNKGLAEQYGVTGKTISNRIKNLGFKWLPSAMKYEFIGDNLENTLNTSWDYLFDVRTPEAMQEYEASQSMLEPETDKQLQSSEKPSQALNKPLKSTPKTNRLDKIDILLNTKNIKKADKVYRGFYFEQDIIDIVDQAGARNKSELINECLRVVFEEKGLL